jgi:hypothetical protein
MFNVGAASSREKRLSSRTVKQHSNLSLSVILDLIQDLIFFSLSFPNVFIGNLALQLSVIAGVANQSKRSAAISLFSLSFLQQLRTSE